MAKAQGDLNTASDCFAESRAICRALHDELPCPSTASGIWAASTNLAYIEEERQNIEAAVDRHTEGLDICLNFLQRQEAAHCEFYLSVSLRGIADMELARGNVDLALSRYDQSLETSARAITKAETTESLGFHVCGLVARAKAFLSLEQLKRARDQLRDGLMFAERLEVLGNDDVEALDDCACYWETFALCQRRDGSELEGVTATKRAEALRSRIAILRSSGSD